MHSYALFTSFALLGCALSAPAELARRAPSPQNPHWPAGMGMAHGGAMDKPGAGAPGPASFGQQSAHGQQSAPGRPGSAFSSGLAPGPPMPSAGPGVTAPAGTAAMPSASSPVDLGRVDVAHGTGKVKSTVGTDSISGVPTTLTGPTPTAKPTNGPSAMTINFVNSMTNMKSISIVYGSNTYADATTTIVAPPLVSKPANGAFPSSTQVVAPFGWAGRMTLGNGAADGVDSAGSKAEFNFGFNGAPQAIDVDVSYVDGFSVPIVCSCKKVAVSGCNIDLFAKGKCTNVNGQGDSKVCVNDPRKPHGPASPFFAPCSGSAYTFDYDDNAANSQGQCENGTIDCCIGTACKAPARQK